MLWSKRICEFASLAFSLHGQQKDKLGVPYIFHLMEVAEQGRTESEVVVGLMHDYLEDVFSGSDPEAASRALRVFGCTEEEIKALILLRHLPNEPYADYLQRIRTNPLALAVKKADLKSNGNESRLALLPEETQERLRKKYRMAERILNE